MAFVCAVFEDSSSSTVLRFSYGTALQSWPLRPVLTCTATVFLQKHLVPAQKREGTVLFLPVYPPRAFHSDSACSWWLCNFLFSRNFTARLQKDGFHSPPGNFMVCTCSCEHQSSWARRSRLYWVNALFHTGTWAPGAGHGCGRCHRAAFVIVSVYRVEHRSTEAVWWILFSVLAFFLFTGRTRYLLHIKRHLFMNIVMKVNTYFAILQS